MNEIFYSYFESPIGFIEIIADKNNLKSVNFIEELPEEKRKGNKITISTRKQLKEYFAGKLKKFNVPISFNGTEFQNKVWKALTGIPYGSVVTYSDISKIIGNDKSVRAVGSANAKNPISIIVPCHRVIAKSGKLSGYAGGIERKEWLIEHEAKTTGKK